MIEAIRQVIVKVYPATDPDNLLGIASGVLIQPAANPKVACQEPGKKTRECVFEPDHELVRMVSNIFFNMTCRAVCLCINWFSL